MLIGDQENVGCKQTINEPDSEPTCAPPLDSSEDAKGRVKDILRQMVCAGGDTEQLHEEIQRIMHSGNISDSDIQGLKDEVEKEVNSKVINTTKDILLEMQEPFQLTVNEHSVFLLRFTNNSNKVIKQLEVQLSSNCFSENTRIISPERDVNPGERRNFHYDYTVCDRPGSYWLTPKVRITTNEFGERYYKAADLVPLKVANKDGKGKRKIDIVASDGAAILGNFQNALDYDEIKVTASKGAALDLDMLNIRRTSSGQEGIKYIEIPLRYDSDKTEERRDSGVQTVYVRGKPEEQSDFARLRFQYQGKDYIYDLTTKSSAVIGRVGGNADFQVAVYDGFQEINMQKTSCISRRHLEIQKGGSHGAPHAYYIKRLSDQPCSLYKANLDKEYTKITQGNHLFLLSRILRLNALVHDNSEMPYIRFDYIESPMSLLHTFIMFNRKLSFGTSDTNPISIKTDRSTSDVFGYIHHRNGIFYIENIDLKEDFIVNGNRISSSRLHPLPRTRVPYEIKCGGVVCEFNTDFTQNTAL